MWMMNRFITLIDRKELSMLNIKVIRYKSSLDYKRNPNKAPAWDNNDWNNCEDDFFLYWGETEIFRAKVQTVSNMEGLDTTYKFLDTIAPGKFQLQAFVEQRNFYGRIHGLCDCKTLAGDYINLSSVTTTNPARWLVHDDQKRKPNFPGLLTRVKWSSGCFVLGKEDLNKLGDLFDQYGVKPKQYIPGELTEV